MTLTTLTGLAVVAIMALEDGAVAMMAEDSFTLRMSVLVAGAMLLAGGVGVGKEERDGAEGDDDESEG